MQIFSFVMVVTVPSNQILFQSLSNSRSSCMFLLKHPIEEKSWFVGYERGYYFPYPFLYNSSILRDWNMRELNEVEINMFSTMDIEVTYPNPFAENIIPTTAAYLGSPQLTSPNLEPISLSNGFHELNEESRYRDRLMREQELYQLLSMQEIFDKEYTAEFVDPLPKSEKDIKKIKIMSRFDILDL